MPEALAELQKAKGSSSSSARTENEAVLEKTQPHPEPTPLRQAIKEEKKPASNAKAASPPTASVHEEKVVAKPRGFNFKRILIVGAGIVLLGGLGYWGYQWYEGRSRQVVTPPVPVVEEPVLPADWLVKNFGSEQCADELVCGANADPDNDGLKNIDELEYLTDPNLADSDFDGLADIDEIQIYNTDPIIADTDGDGWEDGVEVRNGYSPNVDSDQPTSPLELQVLSENIEKFGLHEPTATFLNLFPFWAKFSVDGKEISSRVYLGVPQNWSFDSEGDFQKFTSLDGKAKIIISLIKDASSTEEYVEGLRQNLDDSEQISVLSSGSVNIGEVTYYTDEYTTQAEGQEGRHVKVVSFGDGYQFSVSFDTAESDWDSFEDLAEIVLRGVRLGPFRFSDENMNN